MSALTSHHSRLFAWISFYYNAFIILPKPVFNLFISVLTNISAGNWPHRRHPHKGVIININKIIAVCLRKFELPFSILSSFTIPSTTDQSPCLPICFLKPSRVASTTLVAYVCVSGIHFITILLFTTTKLRV